MLETCEHVIPLRRRLDSSTVDVSYFGIVHTFGFVESRKFYAGL
jgi:hypothetical protein